MHKQVIKNLFYGSCNIIRKKIVEWQVFEYFRGLRNFHTLSCSIILFSNYINKSLAVSGGVDVFNNPFIKKPMKMGIIYFLGFWLSFSHLLFMILFKSSIDRTLQLKYSLFCLLPFNAPECEIYKIMRQIIFLEN